VAVDATIPSRFFSAGRLPVYLAPFAAATSTVGAWFVLERVARLTILARVGPLAHPTNLAAERYLVAVYVAGMAAGMFGGLLSVALCRTRRPLAGAGVGLAGAGILWIVCSISSALWKVPAMAQRPSSWLLPIAVCCGIGGFLGTMILSEGGPER
jgi:hypothetical protein